MAISNDIRDREYQKFKEGMSGETLVQVCLVEALATLGLTPSGLQNAGQYTQMTVSSSAWIKIERSGSTVPTGAGPQSDRNAIAIQNNSDIEMKIIHAEGVTDPNTTFPSYVYGMVLPPNGGERTYDIKDTIDLWVKAESGSPLLDFEELS